MAADREPATPDDQPTIEANQAGPSGPRKRGMAAGESERDPVTGKLRKRTRVTKKQAMFVDGLKKGMGKAEAAKAAGYGTPAVAASITLRSPAVRALIDRAIRRRFERNLPVALQVAADALAGRVRLDPTRWDVVKFFLKAKGLDAPQAESHSENKSLRDMSLAELERMADRLNHAKTIAAVPELPESAVQITDITGESTP